MRNRLWLNRDLVSQSISDLCLISHLVTIKGYLSWSLVLWLVVLSLALSFVSLAAPGLWVSCVSLKAKSFPSGFPKSGNGLRYSEPAVNWSTEYLPIGNGYLGGMFRT